MTGTADPLKRARDADETTNVVYVDRNGREDAIVRSGLRLVRRSDSHIFGTGDEDAAKRIAAKLAG
jgi:hypothetical protein